MSAGLPITVGVIGSGAMGKRVVEAVRRQADMTLVGVGVRSPSPGTWACSRAGIPLYRTAPGALPALDSAGLRLTGNLEDLLSRSVVVVDCTPPAQARARLPAYAAAGVRAVMCGGEAQDSAGVTFNSFANFDAASGRAVVRVASCSTTGLARLLAVVDREWGVLGAHIAIVLSAAGRARAGRGVAPVAPRRSHHAAEIALLLPGIPIYTQAVSVPMAHGRLAMVELMLAGCPSSEQVLGALGRAPRVAIVSGDGAQVAPVLRARHTGRSQPRGGRPELLVWARSVDASGELLHLTVSIHAEAIVIPETIDCVRALGRPDTERAGCVYETDRRLGIAKAPRCYGWLSSAMPYNPRWSGP